MKALPSSASAVEPENTALSVSTPLSVQEVLGQVALIQQVLGAAMKDGEHYGKIPGCGDKPTLLKPGAEKLCLTFRMRPNYRIDERQLEGGHREYSIQCELWSLITNQEIGQGVGTCSTMEAKYRFRAGAGEVTDKPVPRAYWGLRNDDPKKAQELIGGKGFGTKKVDGQWFITKGSEKVENDNPADHYNTVLKMAKKRALVDAVLTATAASDLFTQDLEDITANLAAHTVQVPALPAPSVAPAPAVQSEPKAAAASAIVSSSGDFRETRIHWGRNRGLKLSELTPQQVHWYETDWMDKKEANGPTSPEDLALIKALKAFRAWRGSGAKNETPAPEITEEQAWSTRIHFGRNEGKTLRELNSNQREYYFDTWPKETKGHSPADKKLLAAVRCLAPLPSDREHVSIDVESTVVQAEEASQEPLDPADQLGRLLLEAQIADGDLVAYLQVERKHSLIPHLREAQDLSDLNEGQVLVVLRKWPEIKPEVIKFRKQARQAEVLETMPLN